MSSGGATAAAREAGQSSVALESPPDVTCDEELAELLAHRSDGRIKLFVIAKALAARQTLRDVYEQGDYIPVGTSGSRRDSVFAFARRHAGRIALTCVPRLIASLGHTAGTSPLGRSAWTDTTLEIPNADLHHEGPTPDGHRIDMPWRRFRDVFSGATLEAECHDNRWLLPAATVFERFPIALLVGV
jgi:maltooligosyltrehalose synthase